MSLGRVSFNQKYFSEKNRSEVWWSRKKCQNSHFMYHNILNLLGVIFIKRAFYETIKFIIHFFQPTSPKVCRERETSGCRNPLSQLQAIQFTLRCQCQEVTAGKEQRKHAPNIFSQCVGCCSLPYQPTPVWSSRFPSLQLLATTPYRRYCIRAS